MTIRAPVLALAISLVNKEAEVALEIELECPQGWQVEAMTSLRGASPNDYNDVGRENVQPEDATACVTEERGGLRVRLSPHSVNVLVLKP